MNAKELSAAQKSAVKTIELSTATQIMLQGGGGTGKTRTTVELVRRASEDYIVTATTGAAARVLKKEFDELGVEVKQVSTVHSALQWLPVHDLTTDNHRKLTEFEPSADAKDFKVLKEKVLIIDEASMICEKMYGYILDLIRYGNLKKVIPVGDFYQLKCVGGKTFKFEGKKVELTEIFRSEGDLMYYQKALRGEIDAGQKVLSHYENAFTFTDEKKFLDFVNDYNGSKTVVAYVNKRVDQFVEHLDSVEIYKGQEVRVSGTCKYKAKDSDNEFKVKNNSVCLIVDIYDDLDHMRDAADASGYDFWLPNAARFSPDIQEKNMHYAKVITDEQQTGFVSIWNGSVVEKEKTIAAEVNKKVRRFLRKVLRKRKLTKGSVKLDIQLFRTLEDRLAQAGVETLSAEEKSKKSALWVEFFVFTQALILRSIVGSTIHKSQGLSVDLIAIDWKDTQRRSTELQYVALTRAKKDIAVLV